MRLFLICCLQLLSFWVESQPFLPRDLHKLEQKYLDDVYEKRWDKNIKREDFRAEVHELFNGYFDSLHLYALRYEIFDPNNPLNYSDHGHNPTPCTVYAINTITGEQINFNNLSQFNNLTDKSIQHISNLDKCYLYLLLVKNETTDLTDPKEFRTALSDGSFFKTNDSLWLFGHLACFGCIRSSSYVKPQQRIDEMISASTRYRFNISIEKRDTTCIYKFTFGAQNRITNVGQECF